MKELKKILLYMDASEEAQRALDAAIHLATHTRAAIIAVHIVNQNVVTQLSRHSGKSIAETEVELEENGWRYLYAAEDKGKNAGAHIMIVQEHGYPEDIFPRLAGTYKVDMIIVGQSAEARRDMAKRRTAEQIVEHAPCAVLIVK